MDYEAKALRAAERIGADISDRRGFSNEWSELDDDIRVEILCAWRDEIATAIREAVEAERAAILATVRQRREECDVMRATYGIAGAERNVMLVTYASKWLCEIEEEIRARGNGAPSK